MFDSIYSIVFGFFIGIVVSVTVFFVDKELVKRKGGKNENMET